MDNLPSRLDREALKREQLTKKLHLLGFDAEQIGTLFALNAQRASWGPQAFEYVNKRVGEWYAALPQKYPDAYNHALVHAMYGSTAFAGVTKFDLPGEDSVLKFANALEVELEEHGLLTPKKGATPSL